MGNPVYFPSESLYVLRLFCEKRFGNHKREIDLVVMRSLHLLADVFVDILHCLPSVRSPDVAALNRVALVAQSRHFHYLVVPLVGVLGFLGKLHFHFIPFRTVSNEIIKTKWNDYAQDGTCATRSKSSLLRLFA